MNNKVFNYLSTKTNQIGSNFKTAKDNLLNWAKNNADEFLRWAKNNKEEFLAWAKENKEKIINWINEHKDSAKNLALKSLLAFLTVSVLLTANGCRNDNDNNTPYNTNEVYTDGDGKYHGPQHDPFTMEETRPREEIEQTQITAKDVLASYDKLALEIFHTEFSKDSTSDEYKPYYDSTTAQFTSLTTDNYIFFKDTANGQVKTNNFLPFYIKRYVYNSPHTWFFKFGKLENIDPQPMFNCVYPTTFNMDFVLKNEKYSLSIDGFGVNSNDFEKLMSVFGVKTNTLKEHQVSFADDPLFFVNEIGYTTYEPIIINRETIKNANQDQLWAIYNLLEGMYSINFEGKPLVKDSEPQM